MAGPCSSLTDTADVFFPSGSHLAGIVGATCNNGVGVCGVSPQVTQTGHLCFFAGNPP